MGNKDNPWLEITKQDKQEYQYKDTRTVWEAEPHMEERQECDCQEHNAREYLERDLDFASDLIDAFICNDGDKFHSLLLDFTDEGYNHNDEIWDWITYNSPSYYELLDYMYEKGYL